MLSTGVLIKSNITALTVVPLKTSPINNVGALNFVVIRTSLMFGTLSTTTSPGFNVS